MAGPAIKRHFATVAGRRVHYSRAGSGPPVLILHESPCSLKAMAVVQAVYARHFTAFAVDTPGYGLSDPLPLAQPEMADFADALAALLDVLGLEQAAVYGRHTGASVAVEFAHRHPSRCAMLLTGGLPVYSTVRRESRLTEYLTPLVPSWDGSHLLWLWFRYREQHVFWPWHDQRGERRSDDDVPDLEFLHRGVVEFLEAGDGYRVAYAAAFRHGGTALATAAGLTVPACFAAHEGDSLFRTLQLFPPGAWTQPMPRDEVEASAAECEMLLRHPAAVSVPPSPPPTPLPGRVSVDYLDLPDSTQVLLRSAGNAASAVPILVLHHAPGSTAPYEALLLALGAARRVIAFDLPGCGESLPRSGSCPDIGAWAEDAIAVLDRLGLHQVHVYGHSGGCAVAVELARRAPARIATLVLDGPPVLPADCSDRAGFAATYAPSAAPEWDGSHLLRVWHHLRDQALWWPWNRRTRPHARRGEPDITPISLNAQARECLKQPSSYQAAWRAVWSYPLPERLGELGATVHVLAAENDVFGHLAPALAAEVGLPCHRASDDWRARAGLVLSLLPSL